MSLLHTTWYGSYILEKDDKGWNVAVFKGAPMDPEKIAMELIDIAKGEVLERERDLVKEHRITHLSEERLLGIAKGAALVPLWEFEVPSSLKAGYGMGLLLEANKLKAGLSVKKGPDDSNILSAVGALTEMDSSLNLLTERIAEWYAKLWPEAGRLVEEKSFLSALVQDPTPGKVADLLKGTDGKAYSRIAEVNIPRSVEGVDLSGISTIAGMVLSIQEGREGLETYLSAEMGRTAPNLSKVVGPIIGARLIQAAGGLERLAKLPSSTVQVLGAERSFFKFLKEGGKPPKHGVLFQHPWVHSLPAQKRGRMARTLASAAALAAKMDAYGGGDISQVKGKLEKRAEQIKASDKKKAVGGGRQPPYRDGWWADKGQRFQTPGKRPKGRRWKR